MSHGRSGRSHRNIPQNTGQSKTIQKTTQQQVEITQAFSGPLPPPEVLQKYNEISPGAADRIITMAENEAAHRHEIEQLIVRSEAREGRIGQIFALIIGVVTICTGGLTAVYGSPIAGGFIGTGGVIGLVSAFIWGRKKG